MGASGTLAPEETEDENGSSLVAVSVLAVSFGPHLLSPPVRLERPHRALTPSDRTEPTPSATASDDARRRAAPADPTGV
ncbi:hypothetical protein C498_00805 [Haloferax volcanii DS2]|uniref:Uncharacterized protein n=2 Tax=Haloferax volcanii (strain ATCC 29605 / DSM 3757 / JCM 8879 / NBRC 14742 / NCIMB 2012 / VKM B-1768 / DS2) TaxID=309800 RepID=D4GRQ9_HALVD|nr:hypothetical protein C498_00805 [Haloferax volcanii DS2]